jgi:hypothetical protein
MYRIFVVVTEVSDIREVDNRLPYAIFVTRKNILVSANKMFPGEICLLIRSDAELPTGLVGS